MEEGMREREKRKRTRNTKMLLLGGGFNYLQIFTVSWGS
jgi:hypothetical protein